MQFSLNIVSVSLKVLEFDFKSGQEPWYLVAAPWWLCGWTQPLSFLWPSGIPFIYIVHLKASIAHPHDVDAAALTYSSQGQWGFFGGGAVTK